MKHSYYGFFPKDGAEVTNVSNVLKPLGYENKSNSWDALSWPILWVSTDGRVQFAQRNSGVQSGLERDWGLGRPDLAHFFRVQLPELLSEQSIKVVLNSEYTAVVYRDNRVVIGCQTITHDTVQLVAEAIRKIKG